MCFSWNRKANEFPRVSFGQIYHGQYREINVFKSYMANGYNFDPSHETQLLRKGSRKRSLKESKHKRRNSGMVIREIFVEKYALSRGSCVLGSKHHCFEVLCPEWFWIELSTKTSLINFKKQWSLCMCPIYKMIFGTEESIQWRKKLLLPLSVMYCSTICEKIAEWWENY